MTQLANGFDNSPYYIYPLLLRMHWLLSSMMGKLLFAYYLIGVFFSSLTSRNTCSVCRVPLVDEGLVLLLYCVYTGKTSHDFWSRIILLWYVSRYFILCPSKQSDFTCILQHQLSMKSPLPLVSTVSGNKHCPFFTIILLISCSSDLYIREYLLMF